MVRINLIEPRRLSDQHLIAEYNEILMLVGYVRKYPLLEGIPSQFCLGEGHIKFFKDKLGYICDRHRLIRAEMGRRGFKNSKEICVEGKKWKPSERDIDCIKKRIREKIKIKPDFYRYYGEKKSPRFFCSLLN